MTLWMMTKDGRQPVRGTPVGPLFVHRTLTRNTDTTSYSISHSATGFFVVNWIDARAKAMKIARELAVLAGWDKDLKVLKRDRVLPKECMKILRRHGITVVRGCY